MNCHHVLATHLPTPSPSNNQSTPSPPSSTNIIITTTIHQNHPQRHLTLAYNHHYQHPSTQNHCQNHPNLHNITQPPQNTMDTTNDFINELRRVPKMRGEERHEVVSSLRVALTNNPVRSACPSCPYHAPLQPVLCLFFHLTLLHFFSISSSSFFFFLFSILSSHFLFSHSWMKDFAMKQGLNSVLKCLSYSCDE